MLSNSNIFALVAGICASGASVFGKLTGDYGLPFSVFCIVVMILLNAVMWTFYSKALHLSSSSIGPTVISAGTNYLLSGALGILIFNEKSSLLWWSGISCILYGLTLLAKSNSNNKDKQSKLN